MQGVHSFHIPVLGLAFSIDTPVKVARYGISSVVSIMDDQLIEQMRQYHCANNGEAYLPIPEKDSDHRAHRITAYLNLLDRIVNKQINHIRNLPWGEDNELSRYFLLLPQESPLKISYKKMLRLPEGIEKQELQQQLKSEIRPGSIDVNIMAKVDKTNQDASGMDLPSEFSDALAAFRGYANSCLNSSVVFSAGYNPRLYNYVEQFKDFFPDEQGNLKKRIILKVSDFRSALVQGKIFAKKGLWISEFRIESGLNCGGHAFATEGLLLGPILEEFKSRKSELITGLFELCCQAQKERNLIGFKGVPNLRITVQGGIGTANEDAFLREYFELDGTGWGSPFLLVPEATNVDAETLHELSIAEPSDYYLSDASPLGVPFNNFRRSSSERQRHNRIDKGRPGSPCYKKFLASDAEFSSGLLCTSSREYQHLKIKQLQELDLSPEEYEREVSKIMEKDCLCEGLGASVFLKDGLPLSHKLTAVTICPGPNLAYFSGIFSLVEMIGHIYGRINILNSTYRPNMFINELNLYLDNYRKKIENCCSLNPKQIKSLQTFKTNLLEGIDYYKNLLNVFKKESMQYVNTMRSELEQAAITLKEMQVCYAD